MVVLYHTQLFIVLYDRLHMNGNVDCIPRHCTSDGQLEEGR